MDTKDQVKSTALICSFCGIEQSQCKKIVQGPGVNICDQCVELCQEIIDAQEDKP